MTWATRRRLIIIGGIAFVLGGALSFFYFSTIHVAPSCMDNKMNQDEEGVDCGGSCTYVCTDTRAAPSVRFVRPLSPTPGRTDVIAYIDNPNPDVAARNLPFTIELYSPTNSVVAKKEGTIDLPPSSTVPIFVPDFFSGEQTVARAFVTFTTTGNIWYRSVDTRVLPKIENVVPTQGETPRVTAVAVNPSAHTIGSVMFVATVFDTKGDAIAASRTIAESIPPQGTTPLVFTWPSAFSAPIGRVEVIPILPVGAP